MVILLLTATCCLMCAALIILALWLNHLEDKMDSLHGDLEAINDSVKCMDLRRF